jgi:hypothetical protein
MILRRTRRSAIAEPLINKLTWDVDLKPIWVDGKELPNHQALVRNDNAEVLSVTKKSYHPATNERFLEVVSRIHEFTGFDVEGYSVFQGGRKVLAFLKNNEKMRIGDFDSNNYMVIGNSFDCSTGFFTGISNVVIRCSNQFSRMQTSTTIRHNKQLDMKLDELVLFYKDFLKEEAHLKETFLTWNEIKPNQEFISKFVDSVLDISCSGTISTRKRNAREELRNSIDLEMEAMGNNKYGLFNGVTHYTSHVRKSANKLFGASTGSSYLLNNDAFCYLQSAI